MHGKENVTVRVEQTTWIPFFPVLILTPCVVMVKKNIFLLTIARRISVKFDTDTFQLLDFINVHDSTRRTLFSSLIALVGIWESCFIFKYPQYCHWTLSYVTYFHQLLWYVYGTIHSSLQMILQNSKLFMTQPNNSFSLNIKN